MTQRRTFSRLLQTQSITNSASQTQPITESQNIRQISDKVMKFIWRKKKFNQFSNSLQNYTNIKMHI